MKHLYLFFSLLLCGCVGVPKGLTSVEGFELKRYLGTWYEVARIDTWFEKGSEQVSATYTLKDDGNVKVLNKGYYPGKQAWKTAEGKARFAGDPSRGELKVSFFGPFYAAYNVIALDKENYSWAMVCGRNRSYLWILSRTPTLEPPLLQELVGKAKEMGFETEKLIYEKQQPLAK